MIEDLLDIVKKLLEWITERISEEGGPAYVSPRTLRNMIVLSDIAYPKIESDGSFDLDWVMEETGSDNLVGKSYRIERSRNYNLLREGYELAFVVWSNFRRSRLHNNLTEWAVNYLNSQLQIVWNTQSYKDVHDLMVYKFKVRSSERMERYIPEAVVFEWFKKAFRDIGIPFFVAGRGNPNWWPPDFFEWSQYKFDNVLHRFRDLANIRDLMEAGTILPENVTMEELMDLRRTLRELVYRATGIALNGPENVDERVNSE